MNWHLAIAPVFRIIKGAGLGTSAGFFQCCRSAVFQLDGGQCLADCRHRLAAGTARCWRDDTRAARILLSSLSPAGCICRCRGRLFSKGSGDVRHQSGQTGRLRTAAGAGASAVRLRRSGIWRGHVFTAKYGIFPELFAPAALVGANAYIEVSTVVSILLGVGLGSLLMAPGNAVPHLLAAPAANATLLISVLYGIAAVFARRCPVPLRALLCRLHPPGDYCANFAVRSACCGATRKARFHWPSLVCSGAHPRPCSS